MDVLLPRIILEDKRGHTCLPDQRYRHCPSSMKKRCILFVSTHLEHGLSSTGSGALKRWYPHRRHSTAEDVRHRVTPHRGPGSRIREPVTTVHHEDVNVRGGRMWIVVTSVASNFLPLSRHRARFEFHSCRYTAATGSLTSFFRRGLVTKN